MCMKMKNLYYTLFAAACMMLLASCGILGGKKNGKGKGGSLPNDGQVHGVSPGNKYTLPRPPGMVYVPQGTFHMGPSDEDPAYAFSARNRSVSISGFWMDATEITNNEYRQFVQWVRDSVVARKMGYVKAGTIYRGAVPTEEIYLGKPGEKAKNILQGNYGLVRKIRAWTSRVF